MRPQGPSSARTPRRVTAASHIGGISLGDRCQAHFLWRGQRQSNVLPDLAGTHLPLISMGTRFGQPFRAARRGHAGRGDGVGVWIFIGVSLFLIYLFYCAGVWRNPGLT